MAGCDAEVLNRAPAVALADALHRADVITLPIGDEPRRAGQEAVLLPDRLHELDAPGRASETGKNFRIHLTAEAGELGPRMALDQPVVPRQPEIRRGQFRHR